MSATSLGETTPPGLFDDQPEAAIFDPNGTITNIEEQLSPFHSIVHILSEDNKLNIFLLGKSRKKIILIIILPDRTPDDVITFINSQLLHQQSIHSLYLFFTNGQQHEVQFGNLFNPLLIDCNSITNYLHAEVRDILSTACDLNAKFCGRRVKQEETEGNNGLAFVYEQQRHERLRLQIIYNRTLLKEIDNDHK